MKLIVGLGNPGTKYAGTRHNAGFSVITELCDQHGITLNESKHKAIFGKGIIGGEKVILAEPQTFMNLSGESVRSFVDFYKIEPEDVIVIYDDIALAPGKLRVRKKGSAGGHNGMKNIIAHLGTEDFPRVRVGVGEKPERMDLVDHVLGRFSKDDLPLMRLSTERAAKAVEHMLANGVDDAMNTYNGM